MTYDQFMQLVKNTRAAQNLYFKVRTHKALLDAKYLEGKVDEEIEKWTQKNIAHNLSLFPQDKGL